MFNSGNISRNSWNNQGHLPVACQIPKYSQHITGAVTKISKSTKNIHFTRRKCWSSKQNSHQARANFESNPRQSWVSYQKRAKPAPAVRIRFHLACHKQWKPTATFCFNEQVLSSKYSAKELVMEIPCYCLFSLFFWRFRRMWVQLPI